MSNPIWGAPAPTPQAFAIIVFNDDNNNNNNNTTTTTTNNNNNRRGVDPLPPERGHLTA